MSFSQWKRINNPSDFFSSLVLDISTVLSVIKRTVQDVNCLMMTTHSESMFITTLIASTVETKELRWNFTGVKTKRKSKKFSTNLVNKVTT